MKRNKRFFVIVTAMLLASSAVLTGCMYSITKDYGDSKPYNAESQISISDVFGENDAPTAQNEIQEKFQKMYDINEDENSITVISRDYLTDFWQSNYEEEVIHSLSVDEVFFIIQDTVRIYDLYDTIVLPAFAAVSSIKQVSDRFPSMDEQIIRISPTQRYCNYAEDAGNIHDIIMYRVAALSSPKAFFTYSEACAFCGREPVSVNKMHESVYYISNYSADTDRDYYLSVKGRTGVFKEDPDRFLNLFDFYAWNNHTILFSPKNDDDRTLELFPTREFESNYNFNSFYTTTPGGITSSSADDEIIYGLSFLIQSCKSFYFSDATPVSTAMWGSVEKRGDKLILLPYYFYNEYLDREAEYRYVFYPFEEIGYKYCRAESKPVTGYDFDDGTIFYYEK